MRANSEATEAHPAHESAQQYRERDRGRADDEFEELKPDDLVDECGQAAADKTAEQERMESAQFCTVRHWLDVAHRHFRRDGRALQTMPDRHRPVQCRAISRVDKLPSMIAGLLTTRRCCGVTLQR